MEGMLILVALGVASLPVICLIWLSVLTARTRRLNRVVEDLRYAVENLQSAVRVPSRQSPFAPASETVPPVTRASAPEVPAAVTPPAPEKRDETPVWTPAPAAPPPATVFRPDPAPPPSRPSAPRVLAMEVDAVIPEWRKKLAENWTGVLGAIILVIGVAFFGVLASFYLQPIWRFCILIAVGAAMAGFNVWIRRYSKWADLGAWMQAAGGAIILFACTGAGAIPALQFIFDPLTALGVLSLGLAVNLYFGYTVRSQAIASLHVVFGLVALMVAPATSLILVLGTLVTLIGIFLSYRDRWDLHLLVCLLAYSVFHAFWRNEVRIPFEDFRLIGILCVLAVGAAAGFVHYQKEYQDLEFRRLPFIVHVLNWGLMGFGFLSYSQGSAITVVFIGLGSIAAHSLARLARKRKIAWLHLTDTLVGQGLAILAITRLGRFGMQNFDMAMLAFFEVLIFNWVCAFEKERLLLRIGFALQWATAFAIVVVTLGAGFQWVSPPYDFPRPIHTGLDATNLPYSGRLLILALASLGALQAFVRGGVLDSPDFVFRGEESNKLSILSLFAGLFLSAVYFFLVNESWAAWGFVALLGVLFYFQKRIQQEWQAAPTLMAWILGHAAACGTLIDGQFQRDFTLLGVAVPWLVFDVSAWLGDLFKAKWAGPQLVPLAIYLIAANLGFTIYLHLTPISDFAPGVAYLVLSLVFLELAEFRFRGRKGDQDYLLHAGLFFLILFLSRHLTVHMQSEASVGPISYRMLIEIIALSVLVYWAYVARLMHEGWGRLTQRVAPFLGEGSLLFLIFVLSLEVSVIWQPLCWALLSVLLLKGEPAFHFPPRFRSYSWLLQLASGIQLAFVTSTQETPSWTLWERPWFAGLIAIAAQLGYVIAAYRDPNLSGSVEFPLGLRWLARFTERFLKGNKNSAIFYPLVFSVAIFLYWRFDRGLLTLFWVIEIFGLLSLGIYLKERHFANFAMGALVGCVVRLFIYDLASSSIAIKAGVFIPVGLLVLLMHIIRRKFSERLQ